MANNVNPNDLLAEAFRPIESPKNYRRLLLLGLLGVLVLATLSLMYTIRPALATPLQQALAYASDGKLTFSDCMSEGWGVFAKDLSFSFTPAAHELGNPYTSICLQSDRF